MGNSLELPHKGDSKVYQQSMFLGKKIFLAENYDIFHSRKNTVYCIGMFGNVFLGDVDRRFWGW